MVLRGAAAVNASACDTHAACASACDAVPPRQTQAREPRCTADTTTPHTCGRCTASTAVSRCLLGRAHCLDEAEASAGACLAAACERVCRWEGACVDSGTAAGGHHARTACAAIWPHDATQTLSRRQLHTPGRPLAPSSSVPAPPAPCVAICTRRRCARLQCVAAGWCRPRARLIHRCDSQRSFGRCA
jgi:hypothetical protein